VSPAIRKIRQAAQAREDATKLRQKATSELRRYCRTAQAEGVPISEIAREARLSRQGVYDLLADPPPS
jgi:DNA invertase Pin-like site-specific DNA recombinase